MLNCKIEKCVGENPKYNKIGSQIIHYYLEVGTHKPLERLNPARHRHIAVVYSPPAFIKTLRLNFGGITPSEKMEEEHVETFNDGSDLCQQLMDRYAKSPAPHHRHLLAAAAALRSNLSSESLPLKPAAYFAAAISTASSSESLDSVSLSSLVSFMAIALPLVPAGAISAEKAQEAAEIVGKLLVREGEGLGVSSLRAAVKCVGVLLEFCDLKYWDSIKLGFETLLKFSTEKRPKVQSMFFFTLLLIYIHLLYMVCA